MYYKQGSKLVNEQQKEKKIMQQYWELAKWPLFNPGSPTKTCSQGGANQ